MSVPSLLDTTQAASYIGVRPNTLTNWRCTKRQKIPYIKVGERVCYKASDLDEYLRKQTVGVEEELGA